MSTVHTFREVIDTYFEGPDPRLNRIGRHQTTVFIGESDDQYRNFGDYSVFRYPDSSGSRVRGLPLTAATGMCLQAEDVWGVSLFAMPENDETLYRQVVMGVHGDDLSSVRFTYELPPDRHLDAIALANDPTHNVPLLDEFSMLPPDAARSISRISHDHAVIDAGYGRDQRI